MAERRDNDIRIIEELSGLKAEVNAYLKVQGALLAKHDITLHGDNGLTTVVSKHGNYWTVLFWMFGVFFVAGVGAAVAMITN